jgi:hypothetical protein
MDSLYAGVNEKVAPIIAGLSLTPQGIGRLKPVENFGKDG